MRVSNRIIPPSELCVLADERDASRELVRLSEGPSLSMMHYLFGRGVCSRQKLDGNLNKTVLGFELGGRTVELSDA